jgi:LacI family transcriptional regulator
MAADPTELGTIAAQRIFARLDGDASPVQTIVVAAQLIARGSGEIPPADK